MGGGPPVFPQGSTCLAVLWILPALRGLRVRGFHPLRPSFHDGSTVPSDTLCSPKPRHVYTPVWALSLSLAATQEIDVSFSSSGYLDVSVPRVPFIQLCIHCMMTELSSAGFPHSDIRGSQGMCPSPRLFAACHVFLRLQVPRHPPCALSCLTFRCIALQLFFGSVLFSRLFSLLMKLNWFVLSCMLSCLQDLFYISLISDV